LQAGQAIGPDLPPGAVWFETYQAPNLPFEYPITAYFHYVLREGAGGLWQDGTMGYMGAQFEIDGELHYGWLRIEIPDPLRGNGGIIHDLAYNTVSGQPILAGQVPEPSTWALILSGGVFLWWRCRRKN